MTTRTNISRKTARKVRNQLAGWNALIADVKNAIEHSEVGNSDFYVTDRGNFRVTTQYTHDGSRCLNGGEYTYFRLYEFRNGVVIATDDWSAEFDYLQWLHDNNHQEYIIGNHTADDLQRSVS